MSEPDFRRGQPSDTDRLSEIRSISVDAEQAILGAMMYEPAAWATCQGLSPEMFYEPFHGRLFEQAAALLRDGKRADPILLADKFPKDGAFEQLGGVRYLADMIDHAPGPGAVDSFVEAFTENWARRRLFDMAAQAQRAVLDGEHTSLSLMLDMRSQIANVESQSAPESDAVISARDAHDRLFDVLDDEIAAGKQRGLMSGLRCVDRRLGGLKPGWLVIIGARPSMGKTALARCIMYGAAERNPHHEFGYFAVEMDEREITERALSAESYRLSTEDQHADPIAYQDIGNGKINPMELRALRQNARLAPSNLHIDDRANLSFEDVVRRCHALQRKAKAAGRTLGAVCIDYLQLMKLARRNGANDATLWGEVTAGLKRLARELGICIVLLSQLSRAVESRDDKRPQLADLRESGAIEQDANAVLFPFREHYYLSRAEPKAGTREHEEWEMRVHDTRDLLDVIAAKVRQGAVGTDHQTYRAAYDVIEDRKEQPR